MLANMNELEHSRTLIEDSKQISLGLGGKGISCKTLELKDIQLCKNDADLLDDAKTNFLSAATEDCKTVSDLDELTIDTIEPQSATTTQKIENRSYKYVGEVKNGKRNGFGYCLYKNGDHYTGQWKDDKMEGYGKLRLKIGESFEGEFKDSHPEGFVIHSSLKAITMCEMRGFKYSDGVVICKKDKYVIEAEIQTAKDGSKLGFGIINDFCGNLYEGEMLNFIPFGWGIQHKKGKYVYKGQQDKGFSGYGEVYCCDGSKYFGFFKNNKKHGIVVNFNVKEERISFAKYKEDAKNGASLNVYKSGLKVEIWHDGFIVKSIENFDLAKKYIESCYPEHAQMLKIDYMYMINLFGKLTCN